MERKSFLGIELGSTRIKAVAIDNRHIPIASGDYTWKSLFENGIWTYSLDEVWKGLKEAVSKIENKDSIVAAGVSAMMHGYLAFDSEWNLLVPFRTWQNTITAQAAEKLTKEFDFNIPQRWSIAHLYQAILNNEEHVPKIAHITTLAGYVHHALTGENVIGVGEASGIFPIDAETNNYNEKMLEIFQQLLAAKNISWNIREVLPKVLPAGCCAGHLTKQGAKLLEGILPVGTPFAPCEGDAGTGMTATNSIAPGTGNISAGTSIFSMVVLEKQLSKVYEEIDIVATPAGRPVAMVHCNNCTNDTNAWIAILMETMKLFDAKVSVSDFYTKLYQTSLEGDVDCGGVLVCNYMAGEGITHMDSGRPLVVRQTGAKFSLANFMRSQLYSTMATLKIGMDILAQEQVTIHTLTGHGGLFKTPGVGQKYMAAACDAPITCMETAGEGGPYGMALLVSYMINKAENESLEEYLRTRVFNKTKGITFNPVKEDIDGFNTYMEAYKALIEVERLAITRL